MYDNARRYEWQSVKECIKFQDHKIVAQAYVLRNMRECIEEFYLMFDGRVRNVF